MVAVQSKDPPVGVVGTGQLGSVLTDRLVRAGFGVVAYDIDAGVLSRLHPDVTRVASAQEVAALAPVVITCVTDAAAVRECVLGSEGILAGASDRTLLLEMTTSDPATTRQLGEALEQVGAVVVDAPVSRGVPAAVTGTLSVWLGGQAADVDRARPYLEPLASDILHVGPLGAGHTVKAVNMMLMGVNLIATAEAAVVAKSFGVELEALLEVLNASSGGNYMTSNHFPRFVVSGTYSSAFSAGLMRKDLRVAVELAHDVGASVLFGARALQVYNMFLAREAVRAESDNMLIVEFVSELLGARTPEVHHS